ncbi:MAG: hypothetical protein ACRC67_39095 [Inquilinus sp.]|jgi:hypothetical protein|uniref:hypothetical protein n=1 Tax=Bacteria TaxID=2 RepID=UPI00110F7768|nr:hypothetical protein [Mycobacterium sp. KBS0706]TSD86551.1 hypothetical protein FFK22_021920 [Mycobacterium sp. KBS0706]
MTLRHAALAGIAFLVLNGCSEREARQQQALTAQNDLVGLSEARLLSCAGTPARSRSTGNTQYLTYQSAGMAADEAASIGAFGGSSAGSGMGIEPVNAGVGQKIGTSALDPNYCEATFTLVDGRVAEVRYRTSGGYLRTAQCSDIVAPCMGGPTFDPGQPKP